MPLFHSVFGLHHWTALFGPVVALGALLLLVRVVMTRTFDRQFAAAYAALIVATVVAAKLAETNAWINWAGMILKL
jgi:4-amino-4-deoxy-L-arabinose transferase-like glycosyltransferase